MAVAFQRMFGLLERWNNNQITPSLSKPHELSYTSRSNSLEYKLLCSILKAVTLIQKMGNIELVMQSLF